MGKREENLFRAIQTVEDFVINARGGERIIFTVSDDWNENNSLPVVDFSVQRADTTEIAGDLNCYSFEEAIISLANSLTSRPSNNGLHLTPRAASNSDGSSGKPPKVKIVSPQAGK